MNEPTGWICPICRRGCAPHALTCPCRFTQSPQNYPLPRPWQNAYPPLTTDPPGWGPSGYGPLGYGHYGPSGASRPE